MDEAVTEKRPKIHFYTISIRNTWEPEILP